MARPWRIQYPDAVYHVSGRGNNGRDIFLDDPDRLDFIDLLGKAAQRFHLNIFAFCLMTNHYHLFLQTLEANLAAAMQWLNATYSIRFLHRHKQYGHFLQGRYKSVLVLQDEHWRKLTFYIHLNPVRAGIVDDPAKYEWSSFRDYVLPKPRFNWVLRNTVLEQYGGPKLMAKKLYRKDCRSRARASGDVWKEIRGRAVIGSREAVARLVGKFKPIGSGRDVTEFKKAGRSAIDIEAEITRVASDFKVSADDLKKRKRNFPAKLALYRHLVEDCGCTVSATARHLGVSANAVSLGLKRFNRLTSKNRNLPKTSNTVKFKV